MSQIESDDPVHVGLIHEKKKPFKCIICDISFSRKGSLNVHVGSAHEKKNPLDVWL